MCRHEATNVTVPSSSEGPAGAVRPSASPPPSKRAGHVRELPRARNKWSSSRLCLNAVTRTHERLGGRSHLHPGSARSTAPASPDTQAQVRGRARQLAAPGNGREEGHLVAGGPASARVGPRQPEPARRDGLAVRVVHGTRSEEDARNGRARRRLVDRDVAGLVEGNLARGAVSIATNTHGDLTRWSHPPWSQERRPVTASSPGLSLRASRVPLEGDLQGCSGHAQPADAREARQEASPAGARQLISDAKFVRKGGLLHHLSHKMTARSLKKKPSQVAQ